MFRVLGTRRCFFPLAAIVDLEKAEPVNNHNWYSNKKNDG